MGRRAIVAMSILCGSIAASCTCGKRKEAKVQTKPDAGVTTATPRPAAPPDAGPVHAAIDRIEELAGGKVLVWRSTQTAAGARAKTVLLVRGGAGGAQIDGSWTIAHFLERTAAKREDPPTFEVRRGERTYQAGGRLVAAGGGKATYIIDVNGYRAELWPKEGGTPRVEKGLWAGDLLAATSSAVDVRILTLGLRQAPCTAKDVEGAWNAQNVLAAVPPGSWTLDGGRFSGSVLWEGQAEKAKGTYRFEAPCSVVLTVDGKPKGERFEAHLRPDLGLGVTFFLRGDQVVTARVWWRPGGAGGASGEDLAGEWRLFAADPVRSGSIKITPAGDVSGSVALEGRDGSNELEGRLTPGPGGLSGSLEWVTRPK